MKMSIRVVCECENADSMQLKRIVNEIPDTGSIYEDYLTITESDFANGLFATKQSQPDEVSIICQKCGETQVLSI